MESTKKTFQYVYLGFSVGVKIVKKLCVVGEKKSHACDSRKKTVSNGIIMVASLQQKKMFFVRSCLIL